MLTIDPHLFEEAAVAQETAALNDRLVAAAAAMPDPWTFTPQEIRDARKLGKGLFPLEPLDPHAEMMSIQANGHALEMRLIRPRTREARGTFLHFHHGGWTLGTADSQDPRLREIAERVGVNCLSVEYRLAPEAPYPAGPDDCEAAARWLIAGEHDLDIGFLAIGGESAGAHLSVTTLLRLRDAGLTPFHAANLVAGCYDMAGTASAVNWDAPKLILAPADTERFRTFFVGNEPDLRKPDISPIFGDLTGLPPAHFSVGTKDMLLDDSLQMAARWHAANGNASLDVTPGGCHVFQGFRDIAITREADARADEFMNTLAG